METWTIGSTLDWTAGYFNRKKISDGRLDAEILLSCAINLPRLELYTRRNETITENILEKYREFVRLRAQRKPVAYILGEQEFMGMCFKVTEHTLIPRPETELLVEETLRILKDTGNAVLADIGTGCANIAVSIAKASNIQKIFAVDISRQALAVAHQNITSHGLAAKIFPLQGDLLDALIKENVRGKLDIIVSNPPYIALNEMKALEPELRYEPDNALYGGEDGLEFYRRIAREGKQYLKPGGHIILELNALRSTAIKNIIENEGYSTVNILKDYAGLDRVLVGC